MQLEESLTAFLTKAKDADCGIIYVAYSGGVDSHVLLQLLQHLNQKNFQRPLHAVHINHHIHIQSTEWAQHCIKVCKSLDVPLHLFDVDALAKAGENQEQKARDYRYKAFESLLSNNDYLVTAQHENDQAETVLMHLLRGSGIDGLSAIAKCRKLGKGELHRPLLNVGRQTIENYANKHCLEWVEDPSNIDETFRRNYLRKTIIPQLSTHWPTVVNSISSTSALMKETQSLLVEIAEIDLLNCLDNPNKLNIDAINELSQLRRNNLLRHWYAGYHLHKPGVNKLKLIHDEIISATDDGLPRFDWQNYSLQRYQNHLYLIPTLAEIESKWQVLWDGKSEINLSAQGGKILVSKTLVSKALGRELSNVVTNKKLSFRLRQGGEHCQPSTRNHSRSLKKLFSEYSVPPWLRDRWPLLYADDQLIALPGLFVCKGFEAEKNEQGLQFKLDQSIFHLR